AAADAAMLEYGPDSENMRISRRYIRGVGWRYVVRLDGFEAKEEAVRAASAFATRDNSINVIEGQGYKRTLVEEVGSSSGPAKTSGGPASSGEDGGLPSAVQVLRQATKAHGGKKGGAALLKLQNQLRYSFSSRTMVGEDEMKARHTYIRKGTQSRLEVDVSKGSGVSNTIVLAAPNKAWVATHDVVLERDGVQTAQTMARFAPETGLLSIPLGFPVDVKEASEWRGLHTTGRVNHEGKAHLRVAPERKDDGEYNPLEAALFRDDTMRLAQVTWITRGGRVTFKYSDYRPVIEGLVVPHRVRVMRNGKLVEEIEIKEFDLSPNIESDLFVEPTVLRGRRHR
ncbi:MAG: hypothetical protein ACPGTU_18245, partial [Myxococcota bacterium]